MTQPSNVDKLVSIDVARKFEALQEEVDLLKHEVKQTLVDLRGFIMESRTILPQAFVEARPAVPPIPPDHPILESGLVETPPVTMAPQSNLTANRLPREVDQAGRKIRLGSQQHYRCRSRRSRLHIHRE